MMGSHPESSTSQTDMEELEVMRQMTSVLEHCSPYPGDDHPTYPIDPRYGDGGSRFVLDIIDTLEQKLVCVYDRFQGSESYLAWNLANWDRFSLGKWYAERCAVNRNEEEPWETAHVWMSSHQWDETTRAGVNGYQFCATELCADLPTDDDSDDEYLTELSSDGYNEDDMGAELSLSGVQVDRNKYVSMQRNHSLKRHLLH